MRKLTVDDIQDMRAYERERKEFRARIIAMKKRRRIGLGDIMTAVFENTDTMRFQIQEMARVEKIITDEGIQHEVDTYNELIPDPGELSCTLFIELDGDALLREWLPKLVGVQRSVSFWLADGSRVQGFDPDEARLVREDEGVTSTVHYLKFAFTSAQLDAFRAGPVRLVVDHPDYHAMVELTPEQHAELVADLTAG